MPLSHHRPARSSGVLHMRFQPRASAGPAFGCPSRTSSRPPNSQLEANSKSTRALEGSRLALVVHLGQVIALFLQRLRLRPLRIRRDHLRTSGRATQRTRLQHGSIDLEALSGATP